MKKYIELQKHEELADGDEVRHVYGEEWELNTHHKSQMMGFEYRRPVPFTGKVAFLVTYSPMIRVVIDTTGLSDEEIDNKLIQAAQAEFCYNHGQYMNGFGDNIDWEQTKEDTEVPFVEDEPKNPGKYRYLEVGDEILRTDEERVSYVFPIPMDEEWETAGEGITWDEQSQNNGYVSEQAANGMWFRRPITEPLYRPFVESDVIGEGDGFYHGNEWHSFSENVLGDVVNPEFVGREKFRKLIK